MNPKIEAAKDRLMTAAATLVNAPNNAEAWRELCRARATLAAYAKAVPA